MEGFDCPLDVRTVTGYDGTRITYYVAGRGKRRWVLAPGLGTNIHCWKYLFEHFQDRFTMVTWDPRGTYLSAVPADLTHLRVEDHARDMVSVCEALGWKRFVAGGWSMGVQISLEYTSRFPKNVTALTLINGPYQYVLSTALGVDFLEPVLKGVLRIGRRLTPLFTPLARRLFQWDGCADLLIRLRLLQGNQEQFKVILGDFSGLDWNIYLRMIELLHEHSAAAYLAGVAVPTLITAGTHDLMTPLSTAREMHREIRDSELFLVSGGTHYTMTEFPDELHAGLEAFLRRADPAAFRAGG